MKFIFATQISTCLSNIKQKQKNFPNWGVFKPFMFNVIVDFIKCSILLLSIWHLVAPSLLPFELID